MDSCWSMHGLFLQVMREVGWVIFDEIHYMRDPGTVFFVGGVGSVQSQHSIKQLHFNVADKGGKGGWTSSVKNQQIIFHLWPRNVYSSSIRRDSICFLALIMCFSLFLQNVEWFGKRPSFCCQIMSTTSFSLLLFQMPLSLLNGYASFIIR